jgi:hypothetical protein
MYGEVVINDPHRLNRRLYIATALALNRSAHRRSWRGWKPPEYSEKPSEPERWSLSLCYLYTAGGVGELYQRRSHFCGIVAQCRPPPLQDWGRARAAGNRFARDDKEPGPSWGKQLPGEWPRETAETWHTSPRPSRHVRMKGAASLSGAKELTASAISAHAQCVCLLSLQMESIN